MSGSHQVRRSAAVVLLGGVASIAMSFVASTTAGSAVSSSSPQITAHPDNVMVNTKIKLVGVGFKPHSTMVVKECSQTGWVVVSNPCAVTNTVKVRTNNHGRFKRLFTVQLCPRLGAAVTGPITSEQCFIGVPQPTGIDTMTLVGAAPVTVTYP